MPSMPSMATFSQVARYVEFPIMNERLEAQIRLFRQDLRPRDGWLHVPTGPGLGLDPDVDAVRAAIKASA